MTKKENKPLALTNTTCEADQQLLLGSSLFSSIKILLTILFLLICTNIFCQHKDSINESNKNTGFKDTLYIKNIDTVRSFSTNKAEKNIFKDYIAPGLAIFLSGAAFVFSIISLLKNLNVKRNENVKILFDMWNGANELDIQNFILVDFIKANNAMTLTASCWIYEIVNREILYSIFWKEYKYFYEFFEKNKNHKLTNSKQNNIGESISSDMKKVYNEMKNFKKK